MYRLLMIVAAFFLVTGGLILMQPKRSAPIDLVVAQDIVSPQTQIAPEVAIAAAPTPIAQPEPAFAEPTPVIEVTRAAPLPLTTQLDQAAQPVNRGEALFGRLVEERPTLLTTTSRSEDGTLRPSLMAMASNVTPTVQTAPAQPQSLTSFAADPAGLELRTQLSAAPTKAVHTVRVGETLQSLAVTYYQDEAKANLILLANQRLFPNGPSLQVGQLLRIPDISNL